MNFETWLDELIGADTRAVASKKSNYAQSTISRQLSRGHLRPETVIALCRAYDRSPVKGLVETGYINDYEIHGPDIEVALKEATNEQLLDEIMRRSDPQARYLFGNDGNDDAIGLAPHLTPVSDADDSMPDDDGTVREFDYHPDEYAADSSPDEDKLREERGEDFID
ncbi:MAG: DNA-binding protein [Corynebacterium camporealensis]|uniref:DNA-binding protein n=1 Tax=Corynebacterium camporealensis TaxID=161896 RepID=UPI002A91C89E|nr:DNA-binding protein [Corynebacterium camporealensis]MDY5840089.1 DNA-binding protein [Corynebacterium camporealensis]